MAEAQILEFPALQKRPQIDDVFGFFAKNRQRPGQQFAAAKAALRAIEAHLDQPRPSSEQGTVNACATAFVAFGMLLGFELDDLAATVKGE